jgi:UDP:flavonoid glycosyltransferase YjiC (YdhE family)
VRLLFSCRPLIGHLHPLLPLAAAAAAHGHEVAFATADPALADVRARGLTAYEVGPGLEAREEFLRRFPDIRSRPPAEHRALFFAELFVGLELPARRPALTEAIRSFEPDLIVHEVAEPAAPLAAALAGLPYATAGYGPLPPSAIVAAAAAAAETHWRAAGLEPHARAGLFEYLYLDPCPPALQRPEIGELRVQRMRVTPLPEHRARVARPTTVYVTFGTVWNRDLSLFEMVLGGLRDIRADVVVTMGADSDPAALGPLPDNVTVHRFVPQAELLPRCDAVISHGGSGTILGALAHGLPQLVLPQGADQHDNAASVVAAGAGLSLPAPSAPAVADAVTRLLSDAALRAAARRVGEEIAALPSPDVALARLEELAGIRPDLANRTPKRV